MASNWSGGGELERRFHYQVDNVSLQIGLGLPVELIDSGQSATQWPVISHENPSEQGKHKCYTGSILKTIDGITIRKIYVTNIALGTNWSDIRYIFSKYGTVINTYLGVSKNNPGKQFGFVTFENPEVAAWVLGIKRFKDLNGRNIYVAPADSWHQPKEDANGQVIWKRERPKGQLEMDNDNNEIEGEEFYRTIQIIHEEGMNKLNDDCLLHLFSFLTLKQVAGMERVCKRWQDLSYQLWGRLRKLSFSDPTNPDMVEKTPELTEYLKRCGASLNELDLDATFHNFDKTTLCVIAKYCKNLEILRVAYFDFGNRCLAHLGRSCPKLKQLTLKDCSALGDHDIISLLNRVPELTMLEISNNDNINGLFLTKLPSSSKLKCLKLYSLHSLNGQYLIQGLQKLRDSLEQLQLQFSDLFCNKVVETVVSTLPNLTSLWFNHCTVPPWNEVPNTSLAFCKMKKITTLDLSNTNFINDTLISSIVNECEALKEINFSNISRGSNDPPTAQGLMKLSQLKQLTHLDLSYLNATDDSVLKRLSSCNPRIKKLVCQACHNLTNEGCAQVINLCNDMEWFDLSGCNGVGSETVSAAVTSVKMRTNKVHLELTVGGTQVEEDGDSMNVPLLTISFVDLSDDYGIDMYSIQDMFFDYSDDEGDFDDGLDPYELDFSNDSIDFSDLEDLLF